MILYLRTFLVLVLLGVVTISGATPAWADSKFSASYNVTYEVQTSGATLVTQSVGLKNLTANFYATEYTLTIGVTRITNALAADSSGANIPIEVTTEGDSTKIHLSFKEKVVGLNRVLNFNLKYESTDIAVRNGFIWEVTIPKIASPEGIDSYSLVLKTPKEIGSVADISPTPTATASSGNFNTYTYNKGQLVKSGVNASFGDHQVFNFTLKYHLGSSRVFPVIETIALPPDTETQTVFYQNLSPKPLETNVDTDGNYLAKYRVEGNQNLDVTLTGQVKIWNKPTNPPRYNWTTEQLKKYTAADKYWEANFPSIMEKAKELKTAQAIYDYVSGNLKYDYQRASGNLERLGASVAITQPSKAVCMEFTDLFVAMARAAGIPARELDGFAYTTNAKLKPRTFSGGSGEKSDILHAWAEYWNAEKKTWVQIDPTWGSTTGGVDYFNKLDTNHFVFVIKGVSSVEPFPAGSYKTDPKSQTGDVDVSVAPAEIDGGAKPEVRLSISRDLVSGLPYSGTATLSNSGQTSVFTAKLAIESKVISYGPSDLGPIPPLSKRELVISGTAGPFGLETTDLVKLTLSGTDAKGQPVLAESQEKLTVTSLPKALVPWVGFSFMLIGTTILTRRAWRHLRPKLSLPWRLPGRA